MVDYVFVIVGAILFLLLIIGVAIPMLSGILTGLQGGSLYYDTWNGTGGVDTSLTHLVTQVVTFNNLTMANGNDTTSKGIGQCSSVLLTTPAQNNWVAEITIAHSPMPTNTTRVLIDGVYLGNLTSSTSDTFYIMQTLLGAGTGNRTICYV